MVAYGYNMCGRQTHLDPVPAHDAARVDAVLVRLHGLDQAAGCVSGRFVCVCLCGWEASID